MINFVKLADLIPVQGQITFTIRKADSDHLLILLHPLFPEIKNLSGKEKELYEKARQPLSIKATPAELNEKFFGLLEETYEDDGRLHRALSEKREAGNQLIEKLQKEKNEAKKKGEVKPIEENPASGRGEADETSSVVSSQKESPPSGSTATAEKPQATFNLFA